MIQNLKNNKNIVTSQNADISVSCFDIHAFQSKVGICCLTNLKELHIKIKIILLLFWTRNFYVKIFVLLAVE